MDDFRLFITSTGTGIGKTTLTAALCRVLCAKGEKVFAVKPIITGWEEGNGTDTAIILKNLGISVTPNNIAAVSPWRFKAPLSPDMAAELENLRINFNEVLDFCLSAPSPLIIEGIGGCMVPLNEEKTVLDLIAATQTSPILVTGGYLGALSHTLTALHALKTAGIPAIALVISESEESPVLPQKTAATLARFYNGPIIIMPRSAAPEAADETALRLLAVIRPAEARK